MMKLLTNYSIKKELNIQEHFKTKTKQYFSYIEDETYDSPSGNWTLVSRVTGGDTNHYTNEDWLQLKQLLMHIHWKNMIKIFFWLNDYGLMQNKAAKYTILICL